MFDSIEILRMAGGMAAHASTRQTVVARNVAYADTPGFHAGDIASFAETYRQADHGAMRATRTAHLNSARAETPEVMDVPGQTKPNGNTVSLEAEMVKAAEVRHQHDMALSIYRSSLDLMRASLGRR